MIPYINDIGLSADEIDRVEELHKRFAFVVYNAGFSCTMEDGRKVEMCYWQNLRGVRQSALFPGHAAAWRDALRTHEEAVDAVKANPGVHRVARMPGKEAAELSRLKKLLLERDYSFSRADKPAVDALDFNNYSHYWKRNGMQVGMFKSHADAIRDAIRCWARDEPSDFCNGMNILGSGGEETSILPLTSEELAKLQGFPGFKELPEEHQTLTIQSQQMLKHLAQRGIKIDMSQIAKDNAPSSIHDDKPLPSVIAHKAQGKSFEEVEEDQRNAKRVYGLVEGSPEEKQIRHLEAIGYEFFFTSTSGWVCKQIDRTVACGALMTVVKTAWEMAVSENGAAWQGVGQPPPGTTLWVIPHNTLWGFGLVDTYLCEVLAYHNDHVWLQLLSDTGEVVLGKYITTRIDKVDVKVWKGNKDA